jgi:hypothetical protein
MRLNLQSITSDSGNEYKGDCDAYIQSLQPPVKHYTIQAGTSSIKASFAERIIREIKDKLGRALSDPQGEQSTVVEKIKAIVHGHNFTTNNVILPNIAPADLVLSPNERQRVGAPLNTIAVLVSRTIMKRRHNQWQRSKGSIVKGWDPKFSVGQKVRLHLIRVNQPIRGKFTKVSDPRWSNDIYTVIKVKLTMPLHSYKLSGTDPDGNAVNMPGHYSEIQLRKA